MTTTMMMMMIEVSKPFFHHQLGLPAGCVPQPSSFSVAASEEATERRVYGGIHFWFASDDGLAAGLGIGAWTFTRYLQPKGYRSRE